MTEHPETPRIAYGDRRGEARAPDPSLRIPLPALGWNRPVRPNGHVRIIVASAVIGCLIGSGFLIAAAIRTANAWLIAQPWYQIPFEEIQVTPLPEWYRGGRQAFLSSVKERSGLSSTIPVLGLQRDQVRGMFVQSPWVENVVRVTYPPHGLRVELQYREPVAQVNIPGDEPYLLDGKATILPRIDVDLKRLEQVRPLIQIRGERLTGPLDPRPGAIWTMKPGMADVAIENERIPAVVKLARFLVQKMRSAGTNRSPAHQIRIINPMDPRGLFIFTGVENNPAQRGSCFLWGKVPGDESTEILTDEEMWTAFHDWCEHPQKQSLPPGDFWAFSKEGVRHVRTRPDSRSNPSRHPKRP